MSDLSQPHTPETPAGVVTDVVHEKAPRALEAITRDITHVSDYFNGLDHITHNAPENDATRDAEALRKLMEGEPGSLTTVCGNIRTTHMVRNQIYAGLLAADMITTESNMVDLITDLGRAAHRVKYPHQYEANTTCQFLENIHNACFLKAGSYVSDLRSRHYPAFKQAQAALEELHQQRLIVGQKYQTIHEPMGRVAARYEILLPLLDEAQARLDLEIKKHTVHAGIPGHNSL